ncbi:hypothetical protein V7457_29475 [Bacillus toyonensis]|uniref:hypothetical protein n=1 Tax=Bacillus toyonensis TaxID=155322 RepID=UPI000BEB3C77|nr:hypothetical protein [Bacillus toyonensis]PDY49497.1 hypothetical protein CON61_30355 [Bacillus toyonensis]PEM82423.1 hypothetical protein CN629_30440 [Bacillus toyonensis]PFY08574.1 hypothetical protein COL43_11740 [Bacillus toyonensis]PHA73244.1 hypothetical protein COE72_10375 [Bacillus toyonensis]
MVCEELLCELVEYQMLQGEKPNLLRINPNYYRMILEDLAYPEWLIRKKQKVKDHGLLGIRLEITDQIEKFEMRIVKEVAES